MNIAVFLAEVFPCYGPLLLIPKSHNHGVLAAGHDTATTSCPRCTLDHATVERLCDQGGLVMPTGKPGAVLMFHGNLMHGSAGNITPYPRKIVYQIGRASCRERACQYVWISVVDVSLKKKT